MDFIVDGQGYPSLLNVDANAQLGESDTNFSNDDLIKITYEKFKKEQQV